MESDRDLRGITAEQTYSRGYRRGYDIATARAESRRRLGLPIIGVLEDFDAQMMPEGRIIRTEDIDAD